MSDLSPQSVIAKLDAISRTRALTGTESLALEKAIRSTETHVGEQRFTKRDAARVGIKRDMSVYPKATLSRSERELQNKIEAAECAASILKGRGFNFEAEQVKVLCRAARSLHETARRLHADNMALRKGGVA